MKSAIFFITTCLLSINMLHASEDKIIDGIAPNGIEYLETKIKTHTLTPVNKDSHGLREYCYKTNIYIVYSSNVLGHGYKLSKERPKNLKCTRTNMKNTGINELGLYIGMLKPEVEKLLKVKGIKNKQTIVWQKKLVKNTKRYDLQTYLQVSFIENKLVRLTVFTTKTT